MDYLFPGEEADLLITQSGRDSVIGTTRFRVKNTRDIEGERMGLSISFVRLQENYLKWRVWESWGGAPTRLHIRPEQRRGMGKEREKEKSA